MLYDIIKLGNGWYDFGEIPQGYIKIHALNCGSDKKAMKQGWRILKSMGIDTDKSALCFRLNEMLQHEHEALKQK